MPRLPVRNHRVSHWTEEEHRLFLQGLQLYNRNWGHIARNVVRTRTASQVASHYQKYELHKKQKKRRRSIFDITLENDYQNISENRTQQPLPQQTQEKLCLKSDNLVPSPELQIQQFPHFIDRYYCSWVPTPNEELPQDDQQMLQELQQELNPPNNMSPYEIKGFKYFPRDF